MDTKYFAQALEEFAASRNRERGHTAVCPCRACVTRAGDLTLQELSLVLRQVQELKDADTVRTQSLARMGE